MWLECFLLHAVLFRAAPGICQGRRCQRGEAEGESLPRCDTIYRVPAPLPIPIPSQAAHRIQAESPSTGKSEFLLPQAVRPCTGRVERPWALLTWRYSNPDCSPSVTRRQELKRRTAIQPKGNGENAIKTQMRCIFV